MHYFCYMCVQFFIYLFFDVLSTLFIVVYVSSNMIHVRWLFCTCIMLSRNASDSRFCCRSIQSLHLLELPHTFGPCFGIAKLKDSIGNCFWHCLLRHVHSPFFFLPLVHGVHTSLTSPSGRSHTRCLYSLYPFCLLQTAQRFRSQSWHNNLVDPDDHWALGNSLVLYLWQLSHVFNKHKGHSHVPGGFDLSDLSKEVTLHVFFANVTYNTLLTSLACSPGPYLMSLL